MESATIVPKYVNPPRGNAKSGSIKDADGAYWGIPKDKIEHYSAFIGKAIVVSYEMNGEYRNIKAMMAQAKEQPAARPASNAEDIFVTGVVGRAMGSGQFQPTEIKLLTLAAAEAYAAWKGGERFIRDDERPINGAAPLPMRSTIRPREDATGRTMPYDDPADPGF